MGAGLAAFREDSVNPLAEGASEKILGEIAAIHRMRGEACGLFWGKCGKCLMIQKITVQIRFCAKCQTGCWIALNAAPGKIVKWPWETFLWKIMGLWMAMRILSTENVEKLVDECWGMRLTC